MGKWYLDNPDCWSRGAGVAPLFFGKSSSALGRVLFYICLKGHGPGNVVALWARKPGKHLKGQDFLSLVPLFCAVFTVKVYTPEYFGAGAGMQDASEAPEATGQGERGPFVNRCQNLRFDIFCLFFLAKLCFLLIVFAKALETWDMLWRDDGPFVALHQTLQLAKSIPPSLSSLPVRHFVASLLGGTWMGGPKGPLLLWKPKL